MAFFGHTISLFSCLMSTSPLPQNLSSPTATRSAIIHPMSTLLEPISKRSTGIAASPPLPWLGIKVWVSFSLVLLVFGCVMNPSVLDCVLLSLWLKSIFYARFAPLLNFYNQHLLCSASFAFGYFYSFSSGYFFVDFYFIWCKLIWLDGLIL
ncbi:unnamed protein product [Camellia sinensis]